MTYKQRFSAHELGQLADALHQSITPLLRYLFPNRKIERVSHEMRVGNKGSLSYDLQKRVFHDHEQQKGGNIFTLIMHARYCSFTEALAVASDIIGGRLYSSENAETPPAKISHKDTSPIAAQIWRESVPIAGTVAEHYLRELRGISLPLAECASLRFHPALYHKDTKQNHPAMVAAFANSSGKFQAIHRTYLTDSGEKLTGVKAKAMLGSTKSGAIRLFAASHSLALAEGIENALSYRQLYGVPCWATGSTSNLQSVILPVGITHITIAADNDDAGIQAAQTAARRLIAEGRTVQILTPPDGHSDFNDALQKHKADIATAAQNESNSHD